MSINSNSKPTIDAAFVRNWAATYPEDYDINHYDPFIVHGRNADQEALRKLTEWKNPGKVGPMRLSANKEKAFQRFLKLMNQHKSISKETLRSEFAVTSPVYAIFWHHVIFGTPIFDVHTNRAFKWFKYDLYLPRRESAIPRGGHWELYDAYCAWFPLLLVQIQREDASLNSRSLDRALFRWGFTNSKSLVTPNIQLSSTDHG